MKLFYGTVFPEPEIHPEEQQHITKVLRMKDGEEIFLTDGNGNAVRGNLVLQGKKASILPLDFVKDQQPLKPTLHIAIAPTKNMDRTEFFLEKATELGVREITFLQTEKTERRNLNIEKLRKQAIAASKQSLRFHFPVIHDLTKLQDFLAGTTSSPVFVAHCHEKLSRENLNQIEVNDESVFLIGPEGDFSEREIQLMAERGIRAVSLGSQRLRTETAGVFVAAWNYQKSFE